MKRLGVIAHVLAAGALLASGTTSQAPEAPASKVVEAPLPLRCSNELTAPKPERQKPAQQSVAERTVTLRTRTIMDDYQPIFRDVPQRRRVKDGNRRWVILG